jgi:hypothetical protein
MDHGRQSLDSGRCDSRRYQQSSPHHRQHPAVPQPGEAGFLLYAALAIGVVIIMRIVARSWTHSWIAPGGRAVDAAAALTVGSQQGEEIPA